MAFFKSLGDKLSKMKARWAYQLSEVFGGGAVNDAFWDELETILIQGDVGAGLSAELVTKLKNYSKKEAIMDVANLKEAFADILIETINIPLTGEELRISGNPPAVVLCVGINGTGKTTSIAKLAKRYANMGKKVILAAADTYRAAAIEQLQVWGERFGIRVIAHSPGSDPAAVCYDAIAAARSSGADLVLADTAGRMHTKHNLMQELEKIKKVISKESKDQPRETLLVLDAVTGQNGLQQAIKFHKSMEISGIILAKFDNSAKGGIVLSISKELAIPVRYVGLGETAEDIAPFNPKDFVESLLGNE